MALNQQMLEGSWNEIKGKVRARWGQISDQELQEAQGNVEQLVGMIQQKTGEAREEIEAHLEAAAASGAPAVNRAAEAVRSGAAQAPELVQQTVERASQNVRAGYIQAERMVHHRPAESLAVCFGVGLVTGVLLGALIRFR